MDAHPHNCRVHQCVGLLAGVLWVCAALAQSREETEDWIIKQTQPNLVDANAVGLSLTYAIEDDRLVRRVEFPVVAGGGISQMSIPISRINRIEYVYTDRYLSYSLICATACVEAFSQGGADTPETGDKRRLPFEIYRKLDSSFPSRMHKALLTLVERHGGKAEIVKAAPKKEPF